MGNVPEQGPVLLVGNHTGGNMSPEVIVLPLAFSTYFGVERPFYQLAHNLVLASPAGPFLRRYGTMAASHEHAEQALEAGAAVLVFPGGDWEVHRPSWEGNKIDFARPQGLHQAGARTPTCRSSPWSRSAARRRRSSSAAAPGWRSSPAPSDTCGSRCCRSRSRCRGSSTSATCSGHLPLPAKITIEVGQPIDLREQFGDEPDLDEVYDHVTGLMQDTLDGLAAERRFPVIG